MLSSRESNQRNYNLKVMKQQVCDATKVCMADGRLSALAFLKGQGGPSMCPTWCQRQPPAPRSLPPQSSPGGRSAAPSSASRPARLDPSA